MPFRGHLPQKTVLTPASWRTGRRLLQCLCGWVLGFLHCSRYMVPICNLYMRLHSTEIQICMGRLDTLCGVQLPEILPIFTYKRKQDFSPTAVFSVRSFPLLGWTYFILKSNSRPLIQFVTEPLQPTRGVSPILLSPHDVSGWLPAVTISFLTNKLFN